MKGRTYYDHEPAYQRIAAAGGSGWDDLFPDQVFDSYGALDAFLASPLAPPAGRALDLGCGGGQVSRKLAARGFAVTGVDYSPTAIALARAHTSELGVEYMEGDCLDLVALASGSFDLVIDNHVLHCVIGADRGRFLAEVARVLRDGGVFFSETMSREGDLDVAIATGPHEPSSMQSSSARGSRSSFATSRRRGRARARTSSALRATRTRAPHRESVGWRRCLRR
jgi:2-polyprenyl-3-methyl-5-hydroxy-6-metoxy-1,4-benzoquinol methylase